MSQELAIVEYIVIRLFGRINPMTVQSYIYMLNKEHEFCGLSKRNYERLLLARRFLNKLYNEKQEKPSVVCEELRQSINCIYSDKFQVSYDWMVISNDRKLNTECFYKFYTMTHDSKEIALNIKSLLN